MSITIPITILWFHKNVENWQTRSSHSIFELYINKELCRIRQRIQAYVLVIYKSRPDLVFQTIQWFIFTTNQNVTFKNLDIIFISRFSNRFHRDRCESFSYGRETLQWLEVIFEMTTDILVRRVYQSLKVYLDNRTCLRYSFKLASCERLFIFCLFSKSVFQCLLMLLCFNYKYFAPKFYK